jgi:tRNA U34 5-methylaminomethyl-2-thiouridine-forming methyltransferase MnmC
LLLANNTNSTQTAQISIRGFPVLRQARIRVFDDPLQSVRFDALPKSPFQTIQLAPYAVAVVQFIEPPKAAKR